MFYTLGNVAYKMCVQLFLDTSYCYIIITEISRHYKIRLYYNIIQSFFKCQKTIINIYFYFSLFSLQIQIDIFKTRL